MFSCALFSPSSSLSDLLMCGIYLCRDVQKSTATLVVRHHLLIVTNVEKNDILHGVAINLGRSMLKKILSCFFAKTFKHVYLELRYACQICAQVRCKLNINWSHHPDYLVQKLSSPFIQDNHIIF